MTNMLENPGIGRIDYFNGRHWRNYAPEEEIDYDAGGLVHVPIGSIAVGAVAPGLNPATFVAEITKGSKVMIAGSYRMGNIGVAHLSPNKNFDLTHAMFKHTPSLLVAPYIHLMSGEETVFSSARAQETFAAFNLNFKETRISNGDVISASCQSGEILVHNGLGEELHQYQIPRQPQQISPEV